MGARRENQNTSIVTTAAASQERVSMTTAPSAGSVRYPPTTTPRGKRELRHRPVMVEPATTVPSVPRQVRAMGSQPALLPERTQKKRSLRLAPQAQPATSRSNPRRHRTARRTLSLTRPTPAGSGAAVRTPREPASTAVPDTGLAPAAVSASSWCVACATKKIWPARESKSRRRQKPSVGGESGSVNGNARNSCMRFACSEKRTSGYGGSQRRGSKKEALPCRHGRPRLWTRRHVSKSGRHAPRVEPCR